jgi:short-subunit dehydrogenase
MPKKVHNYVVLITGASSGIGAALSKAYAAPGVSLIMLGRNAERLKTVAEWCKEQGATTKEIIVDVCNADAMRKCILENDRIHPLDLIIANAGVGLQGRPETSDSTQEIFSTNLGGVLNTVLPAIEVMKKRQSGQIALVSSLASFKGYGNRSAYCGSKAAVRVYGEGLRESLKPYNIKVSVICPGFVETPLTAHNNFKMPFLLSAEQAALRIRQGLEKNQGRIVFPWPTYMGALLTAWIPSQWTEKLFSGLSSKKPH